MVYRLKFCFFKWKVYVGFCYFYLIILICELFNNILKENFLNVLCEIVKYNLK